jgi:UDPglucose 6-dehydrogenase
MFPPKPQGIHTNPHAKETIMKVVIIGAGYVGLVSGACFAEMGNIVACLESDSEKIASLRRGVVPIYEPGLDHLIEHNISAKRLSFTTDPTEAMAGADVVFICVGTPPGEDGSADLGQVFAAAVMIGRQADGVMVVATKSTVPVGTTAHVTAIIREELRRRGSTAQVDVVNNPEFLKEGSAISDFMGPDRVVVGTDSDRAREIMHRLYTPFLRTDDRVIFMSVPSSELTKYASNAMLATRISFMNELALLAEKVDADIEEVRQGIARDRRIGKYFLYAGSGYGGSCFPKDVSALIHTGKKSGVDMRITRAVNEVNAAQKRVIAEKISRYFEGNLLKRKIAVWGLSFKPETDDVREASAIEIIRILRDAGAVLSLHDPVSRHTAKRVLGSEGVTYHSDSYAALKGADALAVMTEWKEYRSPDWERVRSLLKNPVVFDGRNLYDVGTMKEFGFRYFGIGYGERI